jgi:hypothetical protein
LLQTSLSAVGTLEVGREKADVLLRAGQLSMCSQNISVLDVEFVQRRKLPVRSSRLVTVLEVGDLPENGHLLDESLKCLCMNSKVVLALRSFQRRLLLLLQLLNPVYDNLLKLGTSQVAE